MSAGQTLGPWKVFAVFADLEVRDSDDNLIAALPRKTGARYARMIATAPDLLEALTMVRDADNDCQLDGLPTIPRAARAKIDAAISKATGETP